MGTISSLFANPASPWTSRSSERQVRTVFVLDLDPHRSLGQAAEVRIDPDRSEPGYLTFGLGAKLFIVDFNLAILLEELGQISGAQRRPGISMEWAFRL